MKILLTGILLFAAAFPARSQVIYYDASSFPLLGKATQNTETRYERLPDSLKQISRQAVWKLGKNSAGLAIHFTDLGFMRYAQLLYPEIKSRINNF
jgi:hypothetical protein